MVGALTRRLVPYPLPEPGQPVRLAFVGHRTLFSPAVLHHSVAGVAPRFFDFRDEDADRLLGDLRAFGPHVVVVFRPQSVPSGAFAGLRAATIGVAADPLPADALPWTRALEANLQELARTDQANFDRVIVADPASMAAARVEVPAWRAFPLPVDDRLYAPVTRARRPPRALYIGWSTLRVEQFLIGAKHEFDLVHYAWGLEGDLLAETLRSVDIGINVHPDEGVARFHQRLLVHLAAGHLLLSEPFSPPLALEEDIDYLVVTDPELLKLRLEQLRRRPDAYDRVRVRGRDKAEQYRASVAWPQIVADLLDDLAAFGTDRPLS